MTQAAFQLSRPNSRKTTLISLTPLIDVVFILLVFFMLASSFENWHSIDLSAPTQSAGHSAGPTLLLDVHASNLKLSGESISNPELIDRLRQVGTAEQSPTLLIRSAQDISVQRVINVLDLLNRHGMDQMVLVGD